MIPVILSGGSGTRLWPVSRAAFPKQFVELFDESLLAKTLRRLSTLGSPWVVAVAEQRFLTTRALTDAGAPASQALFEPRGRNTAPAVALVCQHFLARGWGDAIVGIFPADHLIQDDAEFLAVARLAERCAAEGQVVTLGVRPTSPSSGYGYIEAGTNVFESSDGHQALTTKGFREKPDRATAEGFLAQGNFFWNAGMFVFRVDILAVHFERLMPELWREISTLEPNLANLPQVYERIGSESLDYGIMEHLEQQVVIPCDLGWSDVGSWDEVARLRERSPRVFDAGTGENFVLGQGERVYGLVGVSDLIVVDTADALLIARKGSTQGVKEIVEQMREAGHTQATEHVFEHRPWGSFEVLRDTPLFKSKILRVSPGQRLSYQSHQHRSEHWVVIAGQPEVVLDGQVLTPQPGEAVFIPQGAKHRIRNPGAEEVEIVEVQIGSYFGEDDIVRYEDDYARA